MLSNSPGKILIVDDEPEIASALKVYLEYEGYVPSVAHNGRTALNMLAEDSDYTLVLLDISMPDVDGLVVLKHLRESNCDAAVIMMSGHGNEEVAVECMRIGAEDYISKPFAMEDMLQRVKRARSHRQALLEKRQLEREKEDFSLMLSHDMKNPMTAIIGSIDIIREGRLGPVNPEQADYLQAAIDSCNEVVTMIDNLLDIRRFEAGKMQLDVRPYQPEDIIRKVFGQFSRAAEHDGLHLSLQLAQDLPRFAVDRNAMVRVLGNLIGNSLKFTPEGGTIVLSVKPVEQSEELTAKIPSYLTLPEHFATAGSLIWLSVRDTGNGIPAHELDKIFDRYIQSRNRSDRERGGAGLGLTFCKFAVESFGGLIWAESETGQGSEFIILIPVCNS